MASGAQAALFRAVQESLFNVRKHADARSVFVDLDAGSSRVTATITDDGTGWNSEEGLGLATTRRALEGLGGGLDIARRHGGGTTVVAWVPVAREEQLV
jgi:signal transduction histidine kinase